MRLGFALMMSAVIGSGLMSACSSVGDGVTTPTSVEAGSSSSANLFHRLSVPHPLYRTRAIVTRRSGPSERRRAQACWSVHALRPKPARRGFCDPISRSRWIYLGSRLNLGLDARDIVRSVTCG